MPAGWVVAQTTIGQENTVGVRLPILLKTKAWLQEAKKEFELLKGLKGADSKWMQAVIDILMAELAMLQ